MRCTIQFMELDSLDRALLQELQNDARQTNRDLAAKTGVSPSTSLERVRLLRERGVITGYRATVDLESLGRPVQALISVRIRPPARKVIEEFREWASKLPETIGLFVTTGSQDFLLHIAVPEVDAVYAFVIDRLTERREVIDVQTAMVFEHVQARRIDPISPEDPRPARSTR
jgi:DNA-binding Lrp family transcriptional regulator